MLEEPPTGGWPTITNENVRLLGKNDEVAELMRHLPYISYDCLLAPHSEVAHWPQLFTQHPRKSGVPFDGTNIDDLRLLSEDLDWETVPSSAFGILIGEDTMILDTKFGVVHWVEGSPGEVRNNPIREGIHEYSISDCTPEDEYGWRCGPAWAIVDFFEVLKSLYRDLLFVPSNDFQTEQWNDSYMEDDYAPYMRCVRQVYKNHGWPDMSVYNKEECMKSIDKMTQERFPDGAIL
jgi:hypothetical protein